MKNLFKITAGVLASLLLITSCMQSDVDSMSSDIDVNAITFSSSINQVATRVEGNSFESGDEISVSAYAGDELYAKDVKYVYADSTFTSSDPIKLSYDCPSLSYWAVYPYMAIEDGVVNFSIAADQSVDGAYEKSDFLSSYVSTTPQKSPLLTFNHMLSKVVINLSTDELNLASAQVSLSSATEVYFDIKTGSYEISDSEQIITPAYNGTNSYKAIIMPGIIAAGGNLASIVIEDLEFAVEAPVDFIFESGCQYTYNLMLTQNPDSGEIEVTFIGAIIGDWEDGDGYEEDPNNDYTWNLVTADDGSATAIWLDGVLGGELGRTNYATKTVEIYEAAEIPGFYRVENLYTADFTSQIWDSAGAIDPETQTVYTYIHAENPDAVWIEYHDSGYYLDDNFGNFWYGSYCEENTEATGYNMGSSYGTLIDGVITFPANSLFLAFPESDEQPRVNRNEIVVTLPGSTKPEASSSITFNGIEESASEEGFDVFAYFMSTSNATTSYIQCAVIVGDCDAARVDEVVTAIKAGQTGFKSNANGSIATKVTEAGFYTVVAVPYNIYDEAGEGCVAQVLFEPLVADFTLDDGDYTLSRYSDYYSYNAGWSTEILNFTTVDAATGQVAITGLFEGQSDAVVTGYFHPVVQKLYIPSEQFLGEAMWDNTQCDVTLNSCYTSGLLFALSADDLRLVNNEEWGYALSVGAWHNIFKSSNITKGVNDAVTNGDYTFVEGNFALKTTSYFDETVEETTITINYVDASTGEVAIGGLFSGYSPNLVTGYYDAVLQAISIPSWQDLGEFSFGDSGMANVYLQNSNGGFDIVFTLSSDGATFTTSQVWGYFADGLGWYDAFSSSSIVYAGDATAAAPPSAMALSNRELRKIDSFTAKNSNELIAR